MLTPTDQGTSDSRRASGLGVGPIIGGCRFAQRGPSGERTTQDSIDIEDHRPHSPRVTTGVSRDDRLRPRMHSLLGHLTDLAANELRADTLFIGIPAISLEHGLMSDHMPEILRDRAMRRMVRDVVVLADSRKFERVAPTGRGSGPP